MAFRENDFIKGVKRARKVMVRRKKRKWEQENETIGRKTEGEMKEVPNLTRDLRALRLKQQYTYQVLAGRSANAA